jgi:hypothetical protein
MDKESLLVGVTIHICRDAGEQENNFAYVEEVLDKRGVGQFKHVLANGPVDSDEAQRMVAEIVRVILGDGEARAEPLGPLSGGP